MELQIDRRIYSDACVSKTIYNLAKDYAVNRTVVDDNSETLHIEPVCQEFDEAHVKEVFLSVLNDYKLRQIIEVETHDIRIILYAKAFDELDEEDV